MEIQKFVVTSNKANYLHGYHTTYGMGEDAYKVMKEMIDYFSEFYKQEND